MEIDEKARRRAEVVDEVSKWTVGAGILVVALAPLAIPILVLTARRASAPAGAGDTAGPDRGDRLPADSGWYAVIRKRRSLRSGRAAEEEVLRRVELAPVHHRFVK